MATRKSEVSEPTDTPLVGEREVPAVDPAQFRLNNETTMVWRDWVAHLPEDASKTDLQEPSLWRRVQSNPSKALGVKDTITIFAHDESWFCEARVFHADKLGAKLRFSKIQEFREKQSDLWSDEHNEVKFENGFFCVFSKASGQKVLPQGFHTAQQAAFAIQQTYPTAV